VAGKKYQQRTQREILPPSRCKYGLKTQIAGSLCRVGRAQEDKITFGPAYQAPSRPARVLSYADATEHTSGRTRGPFRHDARPQSQRVPRRSGSRCHCPRFVEIHTQSIQEGFGWTDSRCRGPLLAKARDSGPRWTYRNQDQGLQSQESSGAIPQ